MMTNNSSNNSNSNSSNSSKVIKVRLDEINLDEDIYPRKTFSHKTVEHYVEALNGGAVFPPIVVQKVRDNDDGKEKLICIDGWHRVTAYREYYKDKDNGNAKDATVVDAILWKDTISDLERFSIFGKHEYQDDVPMLYNVWNFAKNDPRLGYYDYAGKIPGQIIMNLLYYYTEQEELVVDPTAGCTTVNACLVMNRRCRVYDIVPTTRKDIKQ